MNYLRQIFFEMRHQPLTTCLSVIGTSIAVFLIMCTYMISNMDSAEIAPESNRSRILYGFGCEVDSPDGSGSAYLSLELAKELYEGLEGVDIVSFSSGGGTQKNMAVKGRQPENRQVKSVDENYWKIYDYNFEEGAPFTKEEVESGMRIVILSRSTAEAIFGKEDSYMGREILIDNKPWTVTGIVSDVNPLLDQSYSDAFISHVADDLPDKMFVKALLGHYIPILLLDGQTHPDHVKRQIEKRYDAFNQRHKSDNITLYYHGQPWTLEERHSKGATNSTPDLEESHRMRIIGYIILLLIPAINLSSMTRSRMRRRISEIGLRRAFGCTRARIIYDLLAEDFVMTFIGGLIGLLLSFIFFISFSNYFISYGGRYLTSVELAEARPEFLMLFSWEAFAVAMACCLILNILSGGLPAVKAAFINPAEALNNGMHINKTKKVTILK